MPIMHSGHQNSIIKRLRPSGSMVRYSNAHIDTERIETMEHNEWFKPKHRVMAESFITRSQRV